MATMKDVGNLDLGKVGSSMGWKEGTDDLEVSTIPAFT